MGKYTRGIKKIQQLLDDVMKMIHQRQQKDIIILWNDQVEYQELKYTSYLKKRSKDSVFFENAYARTPFTVPTILGIFQGLKSIEDKIYHTSIQPSCRDNSEIIRMAEEEGYAFIYIGDSGDAGLFEKKYVIEHYAYNSSCVRFLDLLQLLLDEERPVMCLLHALVETHNPYLSGELDCAKWYEWPTMMGDTEEIANEQIKQSLIYWDKQLEFYTKFLSDNSVIIFMSDHGKRHNFQPVYKEETTHIVFFVVGKNIPSARFKKLFCSCDLKEVVRGILDGKLQEKKICNDYILLQESDVFNYTCWRYYVENNAEESARAFRAVRTDTELYVKISSGQRYYYLLPDEDTNYFYQSEYSERIKQLDKIAGNEFDDPKKYALELAKFRKKYETHE